MSMRDYAADNYGLVLSNELLRVLASKACNDFDNTDFEDYKDYYVEALEEKIGLEHIGNFTGEAIRLLDDGTDDYGNTADNYCDNTVIFIPLERYPNLFHAAYSSIKEAVGEIHRKIGKYLPKEYDLRENMCHIVGTYLG